MLLRTHISSIRRFQSMGWNMELVQVSKTMLVKRAKSCCTFCFCGMVHNKIYCNKCTLNWFSAKIWFFFSVMRFFPFYYDYVQRLDLINYSTPNLFWVNECSAQLVLLWYDTILMDHGRYSWSLILFLFFWILWGKTWLLQVVGTMLKVSDQPQVLPNWGLEARGTKIKTWTYLA